MDDLDEEMILRILDDNYDVDGRLINKVDEPKKNSIPSSPKDDVIEIESFFDEKNSQQEEVQIQIQNTIEIKNDPPNNEQNYNEETNDTQNNEQNNDEVINNPPNNEQNNDEVINNPPNNEQNYNEVINDTPNNEQNNDEVINDPPNNEQNTNEIINNPPENTQNQETNNEHFANERKADSLDALFTNPHENLGNEQHQSDSDIEIESIISESKPEIKESDNQPEETEPQSKPSDNRAKLLAEKLRQKAKLNKPKKQLSFSFDFSGESSDSVGLKIIVPEKKKRQLLREQMLEAHARVIKEDINEAPNQEIQEEEYEVEEEEEEDTNEKNEQIKDNEIAKTVIEELKKEDEDEEKENLTDEQLEHRLYERIVEMRLTEDLEEIKKIIRIITGQWRSGKLRFGDIAEGLEKAFEGNEQERKELENKRMMRKQRKQKKNEEKTRKLTQENISQLIERAMWIRAGQDENASASDIIRGEMAKLSDNDPRKAIMERLEMDAFVQEERAKNALKERRISKNQMKKVERTSSGSRENSFSKITFKSSQISHQRMFSFNLSKEKPVSKENTPSPKKPERKGKKVDKKFAEFLSKINK